MYVCLGADDAMILRLHATDGMRVYVWLVDWCKLVGGGGVP